ncbi:hypothetical protein L2E82_51572 [Cichorium intybus]|nr:hypothetical protein L2E82_51572 [Cichorium intybus]
MWRRYAQIAFPQMDLVSIPYLQSPIPCFCLHLIFFIYFFKFICCSPLGFWSLFSIGTEILNCPKDFLKEAFG